LKRIRSKWKSTPDNGVGKPQVADLKASLEELT
jgi:hypothetical protein